VPAFDQCVPSLKNSCSVQQLVEGILAEDLQRVKISWLPKNNQQ